jgi:hypothetical protein
MLRGRITWGTTMSEQAEPHILAMLIGVLIHWGFDAGPTR